MEEKTITQKFIILPNGREARGDKFMTPAEHLHFGSGVPDEYLFQPYVPIAIQMGVCPDFVATIREKYPYFEMTADRFICSDTYKPIDMTTLRPYVMMKLAPLGPDYSTIYDPIPLKDNVKINPKLIKKLLRRNYD